MKSRRPRLTSKRCPVVYPRLGPGLGRFGKGSELFRSRSHRAAAPFEVVSIMTKSTQNIFTCPVYNVAPADELLRDTSNENSALALLNALAEGCTDFAPLGLDSDDDDDEDLGLGDDEDDLDFDDDDEDSDDDGEEEEAGDADVDDLEDDDEEDEDDFWDDDDDEDEEILDDDDEEEELFDDEEEED